MEPFNMEEVYSELSKQPGLPQAIGMDTAMRFIRIAASLKRSIIHAQKSSHAPEDPPDRLPDAVHAFLGSALDLCDDYVQGCWDAFKSTIWHYDASLHSSAADAKLFHQHGKQQNLASRSLYPPVSSCINPSCPKDTALLRDYAKVGRQIILFTLEDGACATYHYKLTCPTCKTTYHNNYSVANRVRTYYSGIPDFIEVGKHQFISRDVINMFINLMLISWTSVTNCATVYNESLSRPENRPANWDFSFDLRPEHIWNAVSCLAILEHYAKLSTFRQVIGTAMGTSLAPDYANLFLAGYEGSALKEFRCSLLYYGRFIDDTFAIIVGDIEAVKKFQKHFGELHPNMKMEWTQSRYALPFLDVHVSLEVAPGALRQSTKAAIVTRVYQKALNSYLYIPWKSCHSDTSKRSWVKGELIRYVRLSSKEEDFRKMVKLFASRLRARGYPGKWLRSVFSGVLYNLERPKALTPRPPAIPDWEMDAQGRLYVLKLTHNPLWDSVDFGPIWQTLRDAWRETGLGRPEDRFLASFKKPEALSDRLNKTNRETMEAYHAEIAATV